MSKVLCVITYLSVYTNEIRDIRENLYIISKIYKSVFVKQFAFRQANTKAFYKLSFRM